MQKNGETIVDYQITNVCWLEDRRHFMQRQQHSDGKLGESLEGFLTGHHNLDKLTWPRNNVCNMENYLVYE